MATSASISDPYSGRTQYNLTLHVSRHSVSGLSARWSWSLIARGPAGTTYCLDGWPVSVNVGGHTWSGSRGLDMRSGQDVTVASGTTGWIAQSAGVPKTIALSFSHGPAVCGNFGTAAKSGSFEATALGATVPSAPPNPVFQSATPTTLSFLIAQPPSNGGSAVLDYEMQVLTPDVRPNGEDIAATWVSGTSNQTSPPTLSPDVAWRVRYRARNSVGVGGWSNQVVMATQAAPIPTLSVVPNPTGILARLTATSTPVPPVWEWERRITGQTETETSGTFAASPADIAAVPGQTYDWRVRGDWPENDGPWSAWASGIVQPAPATNPGQFFDGNTEDSADQTYQWDGTANLSASRALGVGALGWSTFVDGADDSGGTGVVARVTGGYRGTFGARLTFFTEADDAGFHVGMATDTPGWADVDAGGTYVGSVFAQANTSQRVAAILYWGNDSDTVLGSVVGVASVLAPSTTAFTRFSVQGVAPPGATKAAVQMIDVPGDGWHLWQGGDVLLLDAAMVSIGALYPWFSGDTPDTSAFDYAWLGAPNESISERTPLEQSASDPLADPDCDPIPLPPRPPVIQDDCIETVGTWRRYWAIVPESEVQKWIASIPTLTLTTASQPARQVRIRYYENPDNLSPEEFLAAEWDAEQIVSFLPAASTLIIDGVSERVFASVNGGDEVAADRLLYGTGSTPATWPTLQCGSAYLVSFDVPLDAPDGNLNIGVALTHRMM